MANNTISKPQCPSREKLSNYLMGTLPDDAKEAIGRHVESCSGCQSTLRQLDETKGDGEPPHEDSPIPDKHGEADAPNRPPVADSDTDSGQTKLTKIGRYRVKRILGRGGFGTVYLAHDDELDRFVAIKVPNPQRVSGPADVEQYLAEARVVAALDHPGIVPVYDVGRTADGLCFVVSKYIEGLDLAKRIKQSRLSHAASAELAASVAGALHHAHIHGVVHRDVKPNNILLDSSDRAYVSDFGLAIKDEDFGKGPRYAGTPAYMSPEQARGEGHRVDGRSDIFSLGAVLYELITGRRPFRGDSKLALCEQVCSTEPRPPRQVDYGIPKELERICLKALSKRAVERYTTAADMADDLSDLLQMSDQLASSRGLPARQPPSEVLSVASTQQADDTPAAGLSSDHRPIRIVPKGLRSFDEHDADFFLELLPGVRDRDGLPEIIRFWKTRIEETDPDKTFMVGLIYGPSGCGKSSLVKAGLMPQLAAHVAPVYVEAAAQETEPRLLSALRKCSPALPADYGLKESLAALRRGQGVAGDKKVVIILDQFEQWLHAAQGDETSELVEALRHCDGGRVQCVVMVRDDFWMAVTRFMRRVEIPIVEGSNSAAVDLFDLRHSRKVLTALGQAFGHLPENASHMSREQAEFLQRAVDELADDAKVVCVRLALFAEMMKDKPWTPASLKQVGGAEGVGMAFLESTFSATISPPQHRYHQQAARAVLKALLPEQGTDIRGHMRSRQELIEASGYARREEDFRDLLRILDSEIRIITPTDPGSVAPDAPASASDRSGACYQLTHDYLVPSIRDWLARKQKETRRGRAELKLAERAELWRSKPESRRLPSCWEWMSIRLLTRKRDWTDWQTQMMHKAGRHHLLRVSMLVVVLLLLGWGSLQVAGSLRADALVGKLQAADTGEVPTIVDELEGYRRWANPLLRKMAADAPQNSKDRLHASLALLPVDPDQVARLRERLLHASLDELPVIRDALATHKQELIAPLWRIVLKPEQSEVAQRLHAASALAAYDPDSTRWDAASQDVAETLVSVNPVFLGRWTEHLRPVRKPLTAALSDIFRDRAASRTDAERSVATNVLADYAGDRPEVLADLVMDADPTQFAVLFPILATHGDRAVSLLDEELNRRLQPAWESPSDDASWPDADLAAVRTMEAADGLIDEHFAFCQTMPMSEFVTVAELLSKAGYRPIRLRPYTAKNDAQAAAVWMRDGRKWKMMQGTSAAAILEQDQNRRENGLIPVDVAGYVAAVTADGPSECYAALWAEPRNDQDDARMYVGISDADHDSVGDALGKDGFAIQSTLQAFVGRDGVQRYSGVRANYGGGANAIRDWLPSKYEEAMPLTRTQWDVDVSLAGKPLSTQVRYASLLAEAEQQLAAEPKDLKARVKRYRANYHLGNDQAAIDDLTFLIELAPDAAPLYMYRAILYARMGNAAQAERDLAALRERDPPESTRVYAEAIVAVYLGQDADSLKGIEAAVETHPDDSGFLYDAACVYAIAATVVEDASADTAKEYADRAVTLLAQAADNGFDDFEQMHSDPDLEPLWQQPGFVRLLARANLNTRYEAVWQSHEDRCSVELHGLDPVEHLERCRELAAKGYRPASISVVEIDVERPLATASVWHRAVVTERDKELLAERQANAAVARLKLKPTENIWSLLKHSPDPRVRGWLIHRFGPMGTDPGVLLNRLDGEQDVTIRRALILSLGGFSENAFDANRRETLIETLSDMYRRDPDPGIHGAAEWLLRHWGQGPAIQQIDNELSKLPAPVLPDAQDGERPSQGTRLWYVNGQGQTLVVIPGPVEFAMGKPAGDHGLSAASWPRMRIGRSYAIGAKRLTVGQYQRFMRATPELSHTYTKAMANYPPDTTQISVNWYEAAQYCRWLSEKEGIPEDQMCYPPISEIKQGMQLPEDYLERTGYRLPSEAEWEYACRSGTVSMRYYGAAEALLPEYGWYAENSDRQVQAAGLLKPNDFGLFDMHGNVRDWCQEPYHVLEETLAAANQVREDTEDTSPLRPDVQRVIRGGAYWDSSVALTSTSRSQFWPSSSGGGVGFRIARTYR